MTITEEYKDLLKRWLKWATTGAPEGQPFTRQFGLCTNFFNLASDDNQFGIRELLGEVLEQYVGELGDPAYPFGGFVPYSQGLDTRRQHMLPERLAFVRAELERLS